MSKLKTVRYGFEDGKATYVYRYKHNEFLGEAICHEDDKDFESSMVGLELAENRAYLQYLKVRRDELLVRYETLKGFYNLISADRNFDVTSSYATKMRNEIAYAYAELQDCRNGVRAIPKMLDERIKGREDLYQKLRKKRKEAAVSTEEKGE